MWEIMENSLKAQTSVQKCQLETNCMKKKPLIF